MHRRARLAVLLVGLVAAVAGIRLFAASKPVFDSKEVTSKTPGHAVKVDIDIKGAKELYLIVTDAGDGIACDWADWAEPRLIAADGTEKKLTQLKWKSATTGWRDVNINANAEGGPLRINNKSVPYGIGTHSNSVIVYELPDGFVRFQATAGLDNGGTDQGNGNSSSVRFLVFTEKPDEFLAQVKQKNKAKGAVGRSPDQAIENLDVAKGLEATLFASEPMILNPSNIDIDHKGRIWMCEIVNYRGQQNRRPEGDRILVLEDTDLDGKADKSTVFYQGKDIDSPHGVCVLGTPDGKNTRVLISAGDSIYVFTDEDGDLKADKKEKLFTGIAGRQHDHGIHAVTFGPDGKYYFNFGNSGHHIRDKDGKPIIDLAGHEVSAGRDFDKKKFYQEGMVFRCNPDGSQFETLGWDFRNNWMVTPDSFGSLWQSDNDDDGNKGVRINFVMEFGNYGYKDEFTSAGWQSKRTNLESEVPLRHWHLNDPGVVPNLLQTGQGSPTGITVYEGDLLPEVFRNQVIHCDAGPSVVRAYPVKKSGAGYTAEMVNVLHGARDNWFRPADVKVAPDGSLFVADWYDPGVGGHGAGSLDSGRIFRVAPPGNKYSVPKFDFSTAKGAVDALKNPNYAVRYMAWTALHDMGDKAEDSLLTLWKSDNPRYRARALWLLGKIPGKGQKYVDQAIADKDPDIRITGLRLARQLKDVDTQAVVAKLVKDPAPEVRRECAVALRFDGSSKADDLWTELALQHDGKDRWYLEALGIGSDLHPDSRFAAWLKKAGDRWNAPAGRDIIWRSRAAETPEYLARIIADAGVSADDVPRYLRAFDFQRSDSKDKALSALAFGEVKGDQAKRDFVVVESIQRLKDFDINDPKQATALNRVLDGLKNKSQYIELVGRFGVSKRYPELLALAQTKPDEQLGVEAIRALLGRKQLDMIKTAFADKKEEVAVNTIRAVGNSADGQAASMLLELVKDKKRPVAVRREAVRSLSKMRNGAQALIKLAQAKQLDQELVPSAAVPLITAPWAEVRNEAVKLFPPPPSKNNEPLPPLAALLKMKGDRQRGQEIFVKTGTCNNCHMVQGIPTGKEVGPNLSEIGTKLSKEAMIESILFPSASISHNYETYVVALANGNVVQGLLTSQTPDSVTLKNNEGLVLNFKKSDIDEMKKLNISLMPADLQKNLTAQDLVDVVEFMLALKKK
ncbi:MAG: PVC-type heme-binding CxxCH protein [Gemmataceae bacterium]